MKPERPVRVFIVSHNVSYVFRMTSAEADGLFVRANNFQRKAKEQDGDLARITMKQVFKSSDSVIRTEELFMSKENETLLCEKAAEVQGKSKAQLNEKTRFEKSANQYAKRIDKQERRVVKKTLKHIT